MPDEVEEIVDPDGNPLPQEALVGEVEPVDEELPGNDLTDLEGEVEDYVEDSEGVSNGDA